MKKGLFHRMGSMLLILLPGSYLAGQSFVTNGSATNQGGGCYQLTPDAGGQSGSIFSTAPINLTQPFTLDARLYFGNKDGNGADGIVFIFATTNTALGVGGGGIGYQGITPSIALEYDDYFNSGFNDPTADHMAIMANGSVTHSPPNNLAGPINLPNIEDGEEHCFSFLWDPVTLTYGASLDGQTIFYNGDIVANFFAGNPIVYFGFSSGTGSLSNIHRVCIGGPQLEPMDDVTICSGESITLQADENGVAWSWDPDPTLSPWNVSDPTATPDVTTTYTVGIDYACGGYLRDTVVVTVIPEPTVIADNTGPVCLGETVQLLATGGTSYQWSGPMGYTSSQQNPMINNVTPGKTGTYTVTVTDAAGCTGTAETEVALFPQPFVDIDPLSGPLCEDGDPVQLYGLPSGGDWSGTISPDGVFDPMLAGEGNHTITYTITDANGCTNSDQIILKVVPNIPATITPEGPFCVTDPVITLIANPPGGTWGEAADSDGQIYPGTLGVGSHLVTYEYTGPSECHNTEIFVEIQPSPDISILPQAPLCLNNPPVQLNASPAGGIWSGDVSSNGQINPAALGPGTFQGIYTYTLTGGCTDEDTVDFTILPAAPIIQNLVLDCDSLSTSFIVSFDIVGGDPVSYSVQSAINGILTPGNPYHYTSDPISSGSAYSFVVDDIHHCDPQTLAGNYSCNCPTNAGILDQTPIVACAGDTILILPPTGIILDPNDTLIYYVHTGNPDSILLTGQPDIFYLTPPLQPEVSYYVAVVAGNISGGNIDLADPCLSRADGPLVTWRANPDGYLTAPAMICNSDSATLTFVLSGTGPFAVTYSDGVTILSESSIPSGFILHPSPVVSTTYTLLSVTDLSTPGCSTVTDTSVTVTVTNSLQVQQSTMICPGDSALLGGGYQTQPGIYLDTLTAAAGCDSIVKTTLSFFLPDTTYQAATTCDMAQAGVFQLVLQNSRGCDSTIITTISLVLADTTLLQAATCDPSQAGVFTNTFLAQDGCDSVVIQTVQWIPTDTTRLTSGTCDITAAGTFQYVLTNIAGCDSVILETITLWPSDTIVTSGISCNPADTGIIATVYQNQYGCDSLILETIALAPSYQLSRMATTCLASDTGTFVTYLQTVQGCDSTVTLTVELLPSDTLYRYDLTCEPLDTGTTIEHYANIFGCDSMVVFLTSLLPHDSCTVMEIRKDVFVPNVFSPNDDGINDRFTVFANTASVSTVIYLRIYDRWGGLVFERQDFPPNDPLYGWNGSEKDKVMNPGVFVWNLAVRFIDGTQEVLYGDVTLIR